MNIRITALLCMLLCLWATDVAAQARQMIQAEYFWDSDPGPGNGTALLASDGLLNEAVEQLLGNSLSLPAAGVHTFHVRVRDNAGNWSQVFAKVILIEGLLPVARGVQVLQAEYFWDTDPGEGSGSPMLAFDGNFNESVEGLLANVSTLPTAGAHKLGIRIRSASGQWGPVFYQVVFVQSGLPAVRTSQVTLAEFFWNTDPGAGNGTAMLAFDGNFNESVEMVLANAALPAVGNHKLGIRINDGAGN